MNADRADKTYSEAEVDKIYSDDNDFVQNEVALFVRDEEAIKKVEELAKQTFPDLEVYAYLPSAGEYDKYFYKFRAYMSAEISDFADEGLLDQRRIHHKYSSTDINNEWYYLRTPKFAPSGYPLIGIAFSNGVRDWESTGLNTLGLRVAFRLIYDPRSKIVKRAKTVKKTTEVYECKNQPECSSNGKRITVTSEAPIIKFAGKECIWLNREDCERGLSTTMECWGLYLIVTAKMIAKAWEHNDFGKSEICPQSQEFLLKGCKCREKKLLVKVAMNYKDSYEKVTPLFTEKQLAIIEKVANRRILKND
ncbi:MAG: hypothetical protein NC184_07830 [Roseburia sp.]|nr:hypothetical protein [Roseburia sp.]